MRTRQGSVLIVSAATGTGHTRAAEALREAYRSAEPDTRVEHIDLLDLGPTWVRAAYGGAYELIATRAPWLWQQVYRRTDGDGWNRARWSPLAQRLLFRGFQQLLGSSQWDLCLCTHFLPCQLAAGQPGFPRFALAITDFTLHRYWVQPGVQRYFVATEELACQLRPRVRQAVVEATGIPISPAFEGAGSRAETKLALGLDPRRPAALVVGGGLGLGVAGMVEAALAGCPPEVQLVAVCGRNETARLQLEALGVRPERLRVFGYVSGISNYMAAADAVVTKPGGLTCSEALALGRPLLLTRPIPGQEVGNTRALVSAGAALLASGGRELSEGIGRLFADEGLLIGLAAAGRRIGRPGSARTVVGSLQHWRAELGRDVDLAS